MVNNDQRVSRLEDRLSTVVMPKYRPLWQHFPLRLCSRSRLPKIKLATKNRGQIQPKICSLHFIVPHKILTDTEWIPTRHEFE